MLAGLTPSPGEDSDQSASASVGQLGGPTYSGRVVPPLHYIPSCSSPLPPVSERSVCHTDTVYASCHDNGNEQSNQQSPTNSASTLHSLSFSTEEASTIEQSEDESEPTTNFITPNPSFRYCKSRGSSTIKTDQQSEDESEATISANFLTPTPSFRCKSRLSSTIENNERSEDESEEELFVTPTPSFRRKSRSFSATRNDHSQRESVSAVKLSADFLSPTPSFRRSRLRLSTKMKANPCSEDESEATSAEFLTPNPSFRRKSRSLSNNRNSEYKDEESERIANLVADFLSPTPSFRRSRLRLSSKIKSDECSDDESETTAAEYLTPNPSFRRKSRSLSNSRKNERTDEESVPVATLLADFLSPTPSFRNKLRLVSKMRANECSDDENEATLGEFLTPNPSFRSKQRFSSKMKTNGCSDDESEATADFFTPVPSFRSKLRLSIEPITVQPTVIVRSNDSETCATCVGDIILEAPREMHQQTLENSVPLNDECQQPGCADHSTHGNSSTAPVDHNDEQSTASELFCCDLFKIEITNKPHNHDNLDVARPSAEPIKAEPSPDHVLLQAATDLSPLSSQTKSAEKHHLTSKTKRSRCFPF